MTEYYIQRTLGAASLIVTEGILVTRQGTDWPHAPGIWDSEQTSAWEKIVGTVYRGGGRIYAQLWHVKRAAHPDDPEQKLAGIPVYAPSAIPARGGKFPDIPGIPGYVTGGALVFYTIYALMLMFIQPTAIPDPQVIIDQFKQAAVNAKLVGFDGVELHCANGFLIAQFLDGTVNTRTHQWGGALKIALDWALKSSKLSFRFLAPMLLLSMPLQETLDTYRYFIAEADKLNISYITLLRYTAYANSEIEIDGTPRFLDGVVFPDCILRRSIFITSVPRRDN